MQDFLSDLFQWFRNPDNRGAVQVLAGVAVIIVAWATGLLKWLNSAFRPNRKDAPPAPVMRQTASRGGVINTGTARNITAHSGNADDAS